MSAAAAFTAEVIRDQYPMLKIPFHARWRHLRLSGRDLWAARSAMTPWRDPDARARAAFDLAVTSVLLDAGAGPDWRFYDPVSGATLSRSEGLAIASLRLFEAGGLSCDGADPLRADATALAQLDAATLATAFQAAPGNLLAGLEGRARLLARLGRRLAERPDLFALADGARPGGLFDVLKARTRGGELPAADILSVILEALGPIWEGRPVLDGAPLGDCWSHPDLGYVPIHKLSQWLSYSLIEPLMVAGVEVVEIDGLTGLAEYRNGGLFYDFGVVTLKDPDEAAMTHDVSSPLVVEWRSLTVALLDRIAPPVRATLGLAEADFPLARVLEGGTWAAGRRIAGRLRADGGPPLTINSDGTVF